MIPNAESGYGKGKINTLPSFTTGEVFVVTVAAGANTGNIQGMFLNGVDGSPRVHATFTLALAQCVTGRGDIIYIAPDYTTGITAAELLSAETKGVAIIEAGGVQVRPGLNRTYRATAALPASASAAIFTVTGKIRILNIMGTVTTVVQTQANNTKLEVVPTVGSTTALCTVTSTSAAAVGSTITIDGTLADALIVNAGGIGAYQAGSVVVPAGTINLNCAATNTGSVKWMIDYEPIDPGAIVVAA
jgi:hypothetical protein